MLFKDLKKNMPVHVLFFYVFIFFGARSLMATPFLDMDENCLKAQQYIFELRFDEAELILEAEKLKQPNNLALPWMEENILFLKLFISEDAELYKNKLKRWGQLISQTEKTKYNNAWYRYILSDMHLHRGLIRLKFDNPVLAGTDIQAAYKYLKENRRMFSAFLPDNMNYGLLSCAFSSVPQKYQWLVKLIGLEGDMETGLSEIKAYLNSSQTYKEHVYLRKQAAFIYSSVQYHLNKNPEEAWMSIEPHTRNFKTNLLENYMRAIMAGYHGNNDLMIDILVQKPTSPGRYPFVYLDYLLGLSKMRRLDQDAETYFKIFTIKYSGKNYVKSAYRYLSWIYQSRGDAKTAKTYYSLCLKKGISRLDEDLQAEKEAKEGIQWPIALIQARLLFDGSYYDSALHRLKHLKVEQFSELKFKLELEYRLARINQEKKDFTQAINHYLQVIQRGKQSTYYYAAYSALQVAYMYEELNNKIMAVYYFKMAKDEFPNNLEYVSGIEHKAKAGLKRLE